MTKPYWEPCIDHHAIEVGQFVNEYFAQDRQCLLIAGAGFDPRTTVVSQQLSAVLGTRMRGLFIREERPNPDPELVRRANANISELIDVVPDQSVLSIDIFAPDGAVVGGRTIAAALAEQDFESFTDIVVDLSALSIGVSFPVVRYSLNRLRQADPVRNLHIMVTANPDLDGLIRPMAGDTVNLIHGFRGGQGLYGEANAVKLWLPQLTLKRRPELQRIHEVVRPDDTCPIFPFPSGDAKASDKLAEYYREELESSWEVDTRNLIYASEGRPVDLYRTIIRIDDERKPVFEDFGGSLLVLSPLGSRMLAIGALMAALDRNLPVYHVETMGYDVDWQQVDSIERSQSSLAHVWLHGDVYPQLEYGETDS